MKPSNLTIHKLRKEPIPYVEERLLERIDALNSKLNCYVNRSETLAPAKMTGIPIAIKDNICVKDELTTCASRILAGFRPPYDATVIERLRKTGFVPFGRTNMDEFAFGSSTETSCYGPTFNPWDTSRIPGGSSGGSAAAVSAGCAIAALGSDTGGSIRQPAALCGVVGLKPTYGRVSRYGLIAFASSLDQVGPITKDVTDCAILLGAIAGFDERDSTSVNVPLPDYTKSLIPDVKGMRIGIPKEYFIKGMNSEVEICLREALRFYKKGGAAVREISLPHTEFAIPVYYVIATAEASSNLARFDGVRFGLRVFESSSPRVGLADSRGTHPADGSRRLADLGQGIEFCMNTRAAGFGKEAKRRILLGTFALSSGYYDAYYLKAQKVRTLIRRDFDLAFQRFDCLITPTSPEPAFKLGEKLQDPLSMYLSDIFTISANLAGIPAISIPCGFTKTNLPIGMQIFAQPFGEEALFRAAYTYEQATEWHLRNPVIRDL